MIPTDLREILLPVVHSRLFVPAVLRGDGAPALSGSLVDGGGPTGISMTMDVSAGTTLGLL